MSARDSRSHAILPHRPTARNPSFSDSVAVGIPGSLASFRDATSPEGAEGDRLGGGGRLPELASPRASITGFEKAFSG
jgi:hypothetical protein